MTDSIRALRASSCSPVGLAGEQADDADVTVPSSRTGQCVARASPKVRRQVVDGRREVGAGLVEVGDHDGARHADGRALAPEQRDRAVDVVGARDDEDGRVGRAQTGPELADEVGVAGGVEQVERHGAGRRTRRP